MEWRLRVRFDRIYAPECKYMASRNWRHSLLARHSFSHVGAPAFSERDLARICAAWGKLSLFGDPCFLPTGIGDVMRTTRARSTVSGQGHGPNLDGGADRPIAAHPSCRYFLMSWCTRSLAGHLKRGIDGVSDCPCSRLWSRFHRGSSRDSRQSIPCAE